MLRWELLKEAVEAGLPAEHVLFDTWFCSPSALVKIKQELHLDVVAMAKKSYKVHYLYQGEKKSVKDIYKQNKKRRGRSRYLLSVEAEVVRTTSAFLSGWSSYATATSATSTWYW